MEALSEKVLEGLCHETGAQGGVLWWRAEGAGDELQLAAANGLVRLEEERERISESELPQAVRESGATTALVDWSEPNGALRPALVVALRRNDELAGLVRLTDKLGGERFDDVDRATAEKLLSFADAAYRNAERFARLERRTLQDPDTGAYRIEYLHDVVRNEIEKANRFGRTFSVLKVGVEPLAPLRKRSDDQAFRNWHGSLARYLARLLRATDLIAVEGDGQFCVLLAETGAVGAAAFKERTRQALAGSEALGAVKPGLRPEVILGSVSYPGDATQLEALLRVLDRRTAEDRRARERERRLAALPIGDALTRLIESGEGEPAPSVASLFRFAISEVGRRPRERNVMFCRPGELFAEALAEGLRRRPDAPCETDLVVLADPLWIGLAEGGVTWLPADAVAGPPFAVHFGDGPSYVLIADQAAEPGQVRWFHSSDRSLAESLAFRLQRELRVPRLG
jgi:diguanylate cyclase (GGDEF)-like protein